MNGCDPAMTCWHDVVRALFVGALGGVVLVLVLNVLVGACLRAWAGPGQMLDGAKGEHLLEEQ